MYDTHLYLISISQYRESVHLALDAIPKNETISLQLPQGGSGAGGSPALFFLFSPALVELTRRRLRVARRVRPSRAPLVARCPGDARSMREREMDQAALAGLAGRPFVDSAKRMIIGGEVGGPRGPIQFICKFMEQVGTGSCALHGSAKVPPPWGPRGGCVVNYKRWKPKQPLACRSNVQILNRF